MKKETSLDILRDSLQNQPRSVTIEVGKVYMTTESRSVEVIGIRTNGAETRVYFRWPSQRQSFFGFTNWDYSNQGLDTFKSLLMELGAINSLTVHPISEKAEKTA